jgi:signal transduction histidine kinase
MGLDALWAAFAAANVAAMVLWPSWETIPFHLIWVSLTLLYGFRIWRPRPTYAVLALVVVTTGALIMVDAVRGEQPWGELFEVPLMSAMFVAMVWHARRRQEALAKVEQQADKRASLLEHQQRFLHDVSHELRTPVTIARGHLDVLSRSRNGEASHEIDVAVDELDRIERILGRLLLLAKAEHPDFVVHGRSMSRRSSRTCSCAGRRSLHARGA